MGLVLKTNIHAMYKKFGNDVLSIVHERAVAKLRYAGEAFIVEARSGGNYKDRTGNLRSSTGYVILKDGKVVDKFFEIHDGKGEEGVKQAGKFANRITSKYPYGYVLICMVGMEYALYLELKGYNVISSAEIKVKKLCDKMFKEQ